MQETSFADNLTFGSRCLSALIVYLSIIIDFKDSDLQEICRLHMLYRKFVSRVLLNIEIAYKAPDIDLQFLCMSNLSCWAEVIKVLKLRQKFLSSTSRAASYWGH